MTLRSYQSQSKEVVMNGLKRTLGIAALSVPVLMAACSDVPTEPHGQQGPTFGRQFYYGTEEADVVERSFATEGGRVSQLVGKYGGTLSVNGVILRIPAGALDRNVEITLTVPAGDQLNIDLEPHGLEFRKPGYLAFVLEGTGYNANNAETELNGAHHTDGVNAEQVLPHEIMQVQMINGLATFGVWHFSNYALAKRFKGLILVGG
jgi:hypothetical protein